MQPYNINQYFNAVYNHVEISIQSDVNVNFVEEICNKNVPSN